MRVHGPLQRLINEAREDRVFKPLVPDGRCNRSCSRMDCSSIRRQCNNTNRRFRRCLLWFINHHRLFRNSNPIHIDP